MKKFFVLLCMIFPLVFCSCTSDTSGRVFELTREKWSAELKGGGKISLVFYENQADMSLESGDKKTCIKGKYVADDSTFVIFMPDISQNYVFQYEPKGNTLDLTYNNSTVTLKACE